jgi:hypothetical protein
LKRINEPLQPLTGFNFETQNPSTGFLYSALPSYRQVSSVGLLEGTVFYGFDTRFTVNVCTFGIGVAALSFKNTSLVMKADNYRTGVQ